MKHLLKFKTKAERDEYMAATPLPAYPYVHYLEDSQDVLYSGPEVDLPFYIENISGLSVKFGNSYEYSRDGVIWQAGTSSTTITFSSEERVYFRATGLTASSSSGIGKFTIATGTCNIGGNLMSMLYGADYRGRTEVRTTYAFYKMFSDQVGLKSARFLALPATILKNYCYGYMFSGCTSLVNAPELPATALETNCYYNMFYGCTSLVNAPELPATTFALNCCYNMFYNCSTLVKGPSRLGGTLAENCFYQMFYGCTSLVTAPALPAMALAKNCYASMFVNCKSLVDAPALPATKVATGCYTSMFAGCASLVNAPKELPAITLAGGATSTNSYGYIGCYASMFSGCTSLVTAPALPATTLQVGCYNSMFNGCTSLVNAPALPATTLSGACYGGMFNGCTSLVTAPVLPATTLTYSSSGANYYGCYHKMFQGCSSLKYIKAMFTTSPGTQYTLDWVNGVAAEGTFVKNSAATWATTGASGIPEGWTVELAAA